MSSINNQDQELAEFFTDVVHLRDAFKNLVAAQTLTKRIFVVHGVGGVGKSSLLKMFRLHCKSVNVPVALASGDDSKSALDVLTHWTEDLQADGIKFPAFSKTFEHYRATQTQVENESAKTAEKLAKGATKTIIETAASTIPGIGPLVGKLGGMGAEALVDWMRGFLSKPDIDLLLDPTSKLTNDFLDDLGKIADKKRIVLMLDTFEQMTALEDWARDVAQRLGQVQAQPLLVIAGRALPNWGRAWSGWMANARVEELKPMSEGVMRELIGKYYATMRGGEPNPTQVDAIIRFARGLPMVVTSAVQLWVKYGVEDFQSVKAEIVANLVDRLMEGVPTTLIPALEAAAIVRWFDQPILRAVTGLADARDVYNELRRFPFVRTRVEGLALHDAVREIMDENLRAQDSERHCELHERAAAYFEKRLEKATGEEAERLGLERLYHRVRADEEAGVKLFQEMELTLWRLGLQEARRTLLNDASSFNFGKENSRLWLDFARCRDLVREKRFSEVEEILTSISVNKNAEKLLVARALQLLGKILRDNRQYERAIPILKSSLLIAPTDPIAAFSYHELSFSFRFTGDYKNSVSMAKMAEDVYTQLGDSYGLVSTLRVIADLNFYLGSWKEALAKKKAAFERSKSFQMNIPFWTQPTMFESIGMLSLGQFREMERILQEAQKACVDLNMETSPSVYLKDLALAIGLQARYEESMALFAKCVYGSENNTFKDFIVEIARGYKGNIELKQGQLHYAEEDLLTCLKYKQMIKDNIGIPELQIWLGQLYETRINQKFVEDLNANILAAERAYLAGLDYRWISRRFYDCAALTGLVRVKHAQGDYAAIPPLLAEAEQLAQQYEYNDHLASLRLTQGMSTNGERINESETTLDYFKQAMIYALRYNRFLLDEVLSGRPQGTPLRPIIPYCLERGQDGRKMLIALRDWWKTGINDIGTPRPDTISPIPEGIALLEAERLAREREPGDGSPQKSVVEQIETALAK